MSSNRIVYQNWIVELGRDPLHPPEADLSPDLVSLEDLPESDLNDQTLNRSSPDAERTRTIREAVSRALGRLSDDEREFVERFYFIGQSYREIAEKSGRAVHKLEAIHKRAFRKLKKLLAPAVAGLFDLAPKASHDCVICRSEFRDEIDGLIRDKEPRATWKPVMKMIKERYGLKISTPQILIGHQKYH